MNPRGHEAQTKTFGHSIPRAASEIGVLLAREEKWAAGKTMGRQLGFSHGCFEPWLQQTQVPRGWGGSKPKPLLPLLPLPGVDFEL